MVARFNAGKVIRAALLLTVACWSALSTAATVEEARNLVASYHATMAEQQDAVTRQDMTAYETLGAKALDTLVQARKAFESAGAGESTDPEVILSFAEVMHIAGDDDLGAEMVERALARKVESAALWRMAGEMRLAMGPRHYKTGVDALQKSLALDGTSPAAADTWFALGLYYLNSEMPEEASRSFSSALAAHAGHVPAQLGDAAAKVCAGEIAAAGAILESVGRAAQPHDTMLRAMMRVALMDFDRTRRTFTDTAENHYAYARLLYSAARFPEAVLAAKRASRLAKDRVDILNFTGAVQLQMGDYPGAAASYDASLKANPDQPPVQQTLEQLRQAQQEAEKAQQPAQGRGPLR